MRLLSKPALTVIISVIVFVGGFFFLLRGCLSKYDERSAISIPLYFEKDGKGVVVSLVSFEKATSYSSKNGFTSKSVSTTYYIQNNDVATGKRIDEKKVKSRKKVMSYPIRTLGAANNRAWLYVSELMAFDPFTLEKIADQEILEQKNPAMAGKFPDDERFYEFNQADKNIYFTANDGSTWKLDTKTLLIAESDFDPDSSPAETEINRLTALLKANHDRLDSLMENKLRNPSRMLQAKEITMAQYQAMVKEFYADRELLEGTTDSLQKLQGLGQKFKNLSDEVARRIKSLSGETFGLNYSSILVNQDTVNGKWYGLYSKQEIDKLYNRISHSRAYEQTARRQFYVSDFGVDKHDQITFNKERLALMSSPFFLDGGLLLDRQTALPIKLDGSFLVLSKNQVGNEGFVQLARVNSDGKQAWTFDSKLKQWVQYIYTGKYLIILGSDNRELSGNNCNLLLTVDLKTGTANRYDFFTDK